MKNKILLAALLLFGFTASANEMTVSVESSPATISAKTVEVFKVYFELGKACADFANGITNDRAALLKACAVASELLKDGLAFAKHVAKTDNVHEVIYEFEENNLPGIKMGISGFKAMIASPDLSDEDLRDMLNSVLSQLPEPIQNLIQG